MPPSRRTRSARRTLRAPWILQAGEDGRVRARQISQRLRGLAGIIGGLRDLLEVGLHGAAERGQRDPRPAPKQRAAQLALERVDRIGQRGLRYAAALGRAREIQLAGERQEVANLVHFHRSTLQCVSPTVARASESADWAATQSFGRMPLPFRMLSEAVHREKGKFAACRLAETARARLQPGATAA